MAGSKGAGALRVARNGSSESLQQRRRPGVLVPVELLQRKTEGKFRGMPRCKEEDGGYGKARDSRSSPEDGGFGGGLRRSGERLATAWGQDGGRN